MSRVSRANLVPNVAGQTTAGSISGIVHDMGFLSKAKEQIRAAQAVAASMSGVEPVVDDIPEFIAPRPQDEVDRLLQGDGSIRAIVLGKRHQVLQDGERIHKMRVQVRLRPRGPAGTLGDEVTVKASVSTWVAALIDRGLDIPVERDPKTGAITKVDSKLLTEELTPRKAEGEKGRKGFAVDPALQGMAETAGAIRNALGRKSAPDVPAPSASDPRRQPVDGTTWETYVAVTAHIQARPSPRGDDFVAQQHGVLPYCWAGAKYVWDGRVAADPELAQLFEQDLATALDAL